MKIYLAGPITGCTFQGCTNWREAFKGMLAAVINQDPTQWLPSEIRCLSPMRAKEYLDQVGVINGDYPSTTFGPLSCSRGIMTRDFFDCTRADVVIANLLDPPKVSIGTVMEIAWCYQARIPLIAVMEREGNLHEHPMISEAIGFRVETLEQAAHTALMVGWPHV